MANYDILGNIAIVKFDSETMREKKSFAQKLVKVHKQVTSVLEKAGKFSGKLRKQKTKWILGEKTKEALYRENGCIFKFDVDSCYFSPRLSSERKEISEMVKKGENVLVMFGGVAPYAITIRRLNKAGKIVSIELNKACRKYAEENVKRNKAIVELVWGDVKKVIPQLKEKFDRIVMARPQLEESFFLML